MAIDRAALKEQTRLIFNEAVDIIINRLGLPNIALSIFSEKSTVYVYDQPPIMSLCLTNKGVYLWKINAVNCSKMHPNEIAWFIIHECLHYILQHIKTWPLFRNKKAANIAADIIVNDLAGEVLKEVVDDSFFKPFKYEFYSGINTLGMLSCDMTLEDVYTKVMLMDEPPEDLPAQLGNHDQHNPDNPGLEQAGEDLGRMFTDVPGEGKASDEEGKGSSCNIPELTQDDVKRKVAGTSPIRDEDRLVGVARAIFNFSKVFTKMTGKKMLRGTDDDIGNTWLKRPRAMISIDPSKGQLPGTMMEPQKRFYLDLFIDVSGSVTPEQCSFFANFVNFIPRKKWLVRIHTFNTEVHSDIEIDSKGNIMHLNAGGGTSFNACARFVLTARPQADNIVIVTDGQDTLDKSLIEKPDRWTWIVDCKDTEFGSIKESLVGKVFLLKAITKELAK